MAEETKVDLAVTFRGYISPSQTPPRRSQSFSPQTQAGQSANSHIDMRFGAHHSNTSSPLLPTNTPPSCQHHMERTSIVTMNQSSHRNPPVPLSHWIDFHITRTHMPMLRVVALSIHTPSSHRLASSSPHFACIYTDHASLPM
uniref:Uncharacterized protein n=1 Tax=Mesocestoides corti TaxID=53468 RepID=A0A5K3FUE0_MESCO